MKKTTDLLVYYLIFQKYFKGFYTNTLIVSLKRFSPYFYGFRKNQNVQYPLSKMIKTGKTIEQ